MTEEVGAYIARLEKRIAALESKFCSRCGTISAIAVVKACGEQPCPQRKLLSPADLKWRADPKSQLAAARLPILSDASQ